MSTYVPVVGEARPEAVSARAARRRFERGDPLGVFREHARRRCARVRRVHGSPASASTARRTPCSWSRSRTRSACCRSRASAAPPPTSCLPARAGRTHARARGARRKARAGAARRWRSNGRSRRAAGRRCSATTNGAQEVFTAWHYARFTEALVTAGKSEYDTAHVRERGAEPHRPQARRISERRTAAASHRCVEGRRADRSTSSHPTSTSRTSRSSRRGINRADNMLFIPEANNATNRQGPANAFLRVWRTRHAGFLAVLDRVAGRCAEPVVDGYEVLKQLTPLILENRGTGPHGGVPRAYPGRWHRH